MEWSPEQDPVERRYTVVVMVPPRVTALTSLLQVVEGGQAELSCRAEGSPAPVVSWTGPRGQQVASNTSILRLARVTRAEAGIYTCTAQNGAGYEAEDRITLDIQCESHQHHICFNVLCYLCKT